MWRGTSEIEEAESPTPNRTFQHLDKVTIDRWFHTPQWIDITSKAIPRQYGQNPANLCLENSETTPPKSGFTFIHEPNWETPDPVGR